MDKRKNYKLCHDRKHGEQFGRIKLLVLFQGPGERDGEAMGDPVRSFMLGIIWL
jgi:hypothetical protein